jgi:hypothetical protein
MLVAPPITRVVTRLDQFPLNMSWSVLAPVPGVGVPLMYCQTAQVDQGLVEVGASDCGSGFGLVVCHSAIHGVHWVTVLSNQVLANELEA